MKFTRTAGADQPHLDMLHQKEQTRPSQRHEAYKAITNSNALSFWKIFPVNYELSE